MTSRAKIQRSVEFYGFALTRRSATQNKTPVKAPPRPMYACSIVPFSLCMLSEMYIKIAHKYSPVVVLYFFLHNTIVSSDRNFAFVCPSLLYIPCDFRILDILILVWEFRRRHRFVQDIPGTRCLCRKCSG